MERKNGKNRSPKIGQRSYRSELKGTSRSVGAIPRASANYGTHQIAAFRENSNKSNTNISRQYSDGAVTGEVVSQLIEEAEKQLTYHEQQAELLRDRLQELRQIPVSLTDLNGHDTQ
ncbi:hypothetical protein VF14_36975 [Nostoc linckia z18]|uniref:Uncharacterized protein n=2 Tax=Nostoc linckia TaxID=92942 RepID=A0A9Q5Z426_NOSLI|nr:hypothetical protein [Nostoc linckia]PHJ74687.1 hypothetical protein VF06_34215 [Nostoc linckia z4]PHJ89579.1 hypothetical protein VF08_37690 [Nostoc linckia z8]PHK27302.1 hypothetical protein VF14_36975 [Nostoc linckia z18]PHJ56048.1 hypothetical protein VF02_34460 [Nostoc linckia z1]PHJ69290.1 hypothetical protein VF05_14005 [Nostoc linckia z3]